MNQNFTWIKFSLKLIYSLFLLHTNTICQKNSTESNHVPYQILHDGNNFAATVGLGLKIADFGTKRKPIKLSSDIVFNSAMGLSILNGYLMQSYGSFKYQHIGTLFFGLGLISDYGFSYLENEYKSFSWVDNKNKLAAILFYTYSIASFSKNTKEYKKAYIKSLNVGLKNGMPTLVFGF